VISRRGFLLGGAAASAGGLVLPSFFERALAHVEDRGEPLLEAARRADELLCARYEVDGWVLSVGEPLEEVPVRTYAELWTEQYGSFEAGVLADQGFTFAELESDPELRACVPKPDDRAPDWKVLDSIVTPEAEAFHLLSRLDLGPWDGYDEALGDLVFWDGPCPGNDYQGVHVESAIALSCLQHRLNQLGTGMKVHLL
jgi:hypothetical protein